MRRNASLFLSLCTLFGLTPTVFGQYPYPPMPYGYPQYPMARPMYYPQAPTMVPVQMPVYRQPMPQPRVYVFGPVGEADNSGITVVPDQAQPIVQGPSSRLPVHATPATLNRHQSRPYSIMPAPEMPMGCDSGCGSGCNECPEYGCMPAEPVCQSRARGHGRFLADVGGYLIYPYSSNRLAFSTTTAGATTTTDFDRSLHYGSSASVGYLFHNCWGVRASFMYLFGSANETRGNNAANGSIIASAQPAPFQIVSPGPALGNDQLEFSQRLEFYVGTVEILKEAHLLDTTFLFGFGGRWAQLTQVYSAMRINSGGTVGGAQILSDRQDANATSIFSGWGPTLSAEVVHPLFHYFSAYGSIRGSYLWGSNRLTQNIRSTSTTVPAGLPAVLTDVSQAGYVNNHNEVTILEAELGLQYGFRAGRCFVYGRAGGVYQRWWDVGGAVNGSANGNITFLGGVARIGIIY